MSKKHIKPTVWNFIDMEGQKFGRLLVVEYRGMAKPNRVKKKSHKWLCKCDCGNEKEIIGEHIRSGNTTSCGCVHMEELQNRCKNLVGKKFGKLTVLSKADKRKRQYYWLCKCECGNKKTIAGNSLSSGKSNSCGCIKGNYKHGLSGTPEYRKILRKNPTVCLRDRTSQSIRDALKDKAINLQNVKKRTTFDYLPYTVEELKNHLESQFEDWMSWDNYGGKSSDKRKTWWVDHIIPQSKFDFTSLEDHLFLECWSLKNLRPLEKVKNMKKGNRP